MRKNFLKFSKLWKEIIGWKVCAPNVGHVCVKLVLSGLNVVKKKKNIIVNHKNLFCFHPIQPVPLIAFGAISVFEGGGERGVLYLTSQRDHQLQHRDHWQHQHCRVWPVAHLLRSEKVEIITNNTNENTQQKKNSTQKQEIAVAQHREGLNVTRVRLHHLVGLIYFYSSRPTHWRKTNKSFTHVDFLLLNKT